MAKIWTSLTTTNIDVCNDDACEGKAVWPSGPTLQKDMFDAIELDPGKPCAYYLVTGSDSIGVHKIVYPLESILQS